MTDVPLPKPTGDPDIDSFNQLVADKLNYDDLGSGSVDPQPDDRGRIEVVGYVDRLSLIHI